MPLNDEDNALKAFSDYFSLLQLKYDCETVYGLIHALQQDGVTAHGIVPYVSLTAASALEFLDSSNNNIMEKTDILKIQDVRLKLKCFEDGFSQSKK